MSGYYIGGSLIEDVAYKFSNTTFTINNYTTISGTNLGNFLGKWDANQGNYFKLNPTGFLNNGTDIGNDILAGIPLQINGTIGTNGFVINYNTGNIAPTGHGGIYYEGTAASQTSTFNIIPGVKFISGFIIGAGGGGGGTRNGSEDIGGSGGGGGGTIYFKIPVDTNTLVTVTCGGGGNGGRTSTANSWGTGGGTGGSSRVNYSNYTLTAPGGIGGIGGWGQYNSPGGNGGAPNSSPPSGMTTSNYIVYNGNIGAIPQSSYIRHGNVGITASLLGNVYPTSALYTTHGTGGAGGISGAEGGTNGVGLGGYGGLVRIYYLTG
jgi:hypothetical protein